MSVSLTLTGDPKNLEEVLRLWNRLQEGSATDAWPDSDDPDRSRLATFLRALTQDGRRLVEVVARHSILATGISEEGLWRELGKPEQVVNGFKGGIGIQWKSLRFPGSNPFARQGKYPGPYFYQIDTPLAARIVEILDESKFDVLSA